MDIAVTWIFIAIQHIQVLYSVVFAAPGVTGGRVRAALALAGTALRVGRRTLLGRGGRLTVTMHDLVIWLPIQVFILLGFPRPPLQ